LYIRFRTTPPGSDSGPRKPHWQAARPHASRRGQTRDSGLTVGFGRVKLTVAWNKSDCLRESCLAYRDCSMKMRFTMWSRVVMADAGCFMTKATTNDSPRDSKNKWTGAAGRSLLIAGCQIISIAYFERPSPTLRAECSIGSAATPTDTQSEINTLGISTKDGTKHSPLRTKDITGV